jgi:hypothetical protein
LGDAYHVGLFRKTGDEEEDRPGTKGGRNKDLLGRNEGRCGNQATYLGIYPEANAAVVERQEVHNEDMIVDTVVALKGQ